MKIQISNVNVPTVLVALAILGLVVWNLSRGGSAGLGPLKLGGKRLTRRPSKPRQPSQPNQPLAPSRPPLPNQSVNRPTPAAQAPADGGTGPLVVIGGLVVAAIAFSLMSVSGQPAVGMTTRPRQTTSASVSAVYAYYAAVNQREWPQAWKLLGQPTPVYSSGYNQWASGYYCTVRDQITGVTPRGDALLVTIRAQESGGVVQTYRFNYVVKHGVLTQGQMLSYTGNAPQGCGE
jgi:hypothetical protein